MKKSTKIILPALALLVLGTTAAATSTVAWFAANGTVKATGMQVQCQTSHNLIISNTNPTTFDGSTDEEHYGSSVVTTNNGAHYLMPSSTATSVLKSANPSFFYAAEGSKINAVSGAIGVDSVLTAAENNNEYYAQHEFWVANSAEDNMNIAISDFKITRGATASKITDALRIAIVYEDNTITIPENGNQSNKMWCTIFTATSDATNSYQGFIKAGKITAVPAGELKTYSSSDGAISEAVTTKLYSDTKAYAMGQIKPTINAVTSAKDYVWSKLTVYTWYEGQDAHCTSNYAMSVEDISIELSFTANAA